MKPRLPTLLLFLLATDGCNSGGVLYDLGPVAATCDSYCRTVNTNCVDANRQYGNTPAEAARGCMFTCVGFGWPAGSPGDTSGNTLACRAYHAGVAAGDPAMHCPHAGPLGGGVCGDSQCADFCAANLAVCAGANAAYASLADCMSACAALTDAGSSIASPTTTTGNTLSCRLYHLSEATVDPAMFCPQTTMLGASGPGTDGGTGPRAGICM